MAQTIKLKNSGTSSNTPSSLVHGELAINYADGKIFYKNSSGNIVEFSTSTGSFLPLSGGTLTGALTVDSGVTVDTINIDGNTIATSSGNFFIDSASDIFLDADGGNVFLRDDGTNFGNFNHNGNNLKISSSIQDGDIVFAGNDGGSTITALTLDMSDAGTAIFNHDIKAGSGGIVNSDTFNNQANSANIIYRSGSTTVVGNHASALVVNDNGTISSGAITSSGALIVSAASSSLKGPVYIAAQNSTGEGGEITLNGSNGNTSHTLDTVNGTFRIFDTSGTFITGNSGYGLNSINGYRVNGTSVIDSSRNTNFNNSNAISFLSTNGYWVAGTRRIDGVGNLENIGTISSGEITSSGSGDQDLIINSTSSSKARILLQENGTTKIFLENKANSVSGQFGIYSASASKYAFLIDASGNTSLNGGTISSGAITVSQSADLHNQFISTGGNSKLSIVSADAGDAWINLSGATNEMSIGYERTSSEFRVTNHDTLASNVRLAINTSSGNATFSGSVSTDTIQNASGNLNILSTQSILLKFDSDNNQTNRELNIQSNSGDQLVQITETGATTFSSNVTVNGSTGLLASKIYAGEGTSSGTRSQLTRSGTTNRLHSFTGSTSATPFEIMMGTSTSALAIDTSSNVNIANGSVGIGFTTAPSTKLEVSSGGADVNTIRASYNSTNYLELAHNRINAVSSGTDAILFQTSGTNRAIINSTGLGLGTTSPSSQAHIKIPNLQGGNNGNGILLEDDGAQLKLEIRKGTGGVNASRRISLYEDGGNFPLYLQEEGGNVGIGLASTATTYSGAKLSVNGSIVQSNNGQHVIGTFGTSGLQLIGVEGGDSLIGTMGSSENLLFRTASQERMRIDSTGSIGFNTSNPLRPFDSRNAIQIFGSGGYTELMLRGRAGTAQNLGAFHFSIRSDVGGDNDDLMLLRFTGGNSPSYAGTSMHIRNDNGHVGIGTNTGQPSSLLHVIGGSATIPTLSSSYPLTISNNGNSGLNIISSGTTNAGQINFGDSGDADIGRIRYDHNDNSMRFSVNATEYMRLGSIGRVGINTTSLTADGLTVGTNNGNCEIDLTHTSGKRYRLNSLANGNFQVENKTDSLTVLTINSSGNAGINIGNPTQKLHVGGNAIITGLTRIGDGSASSPSYQFINDTDTGMFRASSNVLGFSTGGSERMRIDSSGRLNFGQTGAYVPTGGGVSIATFEESSNSRTNFVISNQNSGSAGGASLVLGSHGADYFIEHQGSGKGGALTFTRGASESMRISSAGNIGFAGQTNPNFKLDGGFATQTWGWHLNSSYNAGFTYNTTERSIEIFTKSADNADHIKFSTGGSGPIERMRINSAGNVGIGTGAPARKLSVETTGTAIVSSFKRSDAANAFVTFSDSSTTSDAHVGVGAAGDSLFFRASNVEQVRINNTGLGIGTTSPSSKLQIQGGTSGLDQISISSNTTANTIKYAGIIMTNYANTTTALIGAKAENGTSSVFYGSSGTDHRGIQNHIFYTNASATATSGNTERMRIDSSGNVGIGTVPSGELHVYQSSGDNNLILQSANGASQLFFGDNASLNVGKIRYDHGSDFMALTTNSAERMRIDSSGRVGINNVSPDEKMHISGGGIKVDGAATMGSGSGTGVFLDYSSNVGRITSLDQGVAWRSLRLNAADIQFYIANGEKARLTSGGDLLVGQTIASSGTVGTSLRSDGRNFFCADGNYSAHFNRNTSDGPILHFAKNDTIVGSIGVVGGDDLFIAGGSTGLRFDSGVGKIYPTNGSGTVSDNTVDIGEVNYRFKDLHLSGVANVGGISSTSTIRGPDGSATAASFNSINDINTGLFFPAANNLAVTTDGVERLRVDALGRLGLRTTSPRATFDLRAGHSSTVNEAISFGRTDDNFRYNSIFSRNTSSTGSYLSFRIHDGSSSSAQTEVMAITPIGVGLGTSSPAALLNCFTDTGRDFRVDHGTANRTILSTDRGMIIKAGGGYSLDLDTNSSSGTLRFFANGSESARLTSGGNLLIGKTADNNTDVGVRIQSNGGTSINRSGGLSANVINTTSGFGLNIAAGGTSTSGNWAFRIEDGGGNAFHHFFSDAIGIGTAAPKTHINTGNYFKPSTSGTAKFLTIDGGTNAANIMLQGNITGENPLGGIYWTSTNGQSDAHRQVAAIDVQIDDHSSATLDGGSLRFFTKPAGSGVQSPRMTLLANGNLIFGKTADNNSDVGIRMQSTGHTSIVRSGGNCLTLNRLSSDGSLLDFRKDTATLVGQIGTKSGDLAIGTGDTGVRFDDANNAIYAHSMSANAYLDATVDLGYSGIRFKDAHFSGTVFAATGLGVGTTSVLSESNIVSLQIGSSSVAASQLVLDDNDSNGPWKIRSNQSLIFYDNTSERLRIDNGGNLIYGMSSINNTEGGFFRPDGRASFIATAVSGATLEVARGSNGIAINFQQINGNVDVGSISVTGTATAYNTSSDARLKDNIEDAKDSGDIIDKIKVRQFDWKKTGKHQDYGMIAQELILEVPDAVSTPTEDHEMMGVDYSKLVPMLVKEIQSLRARVQTLEKEK